MTGALGQLAGELASLHDAHVECVEDAFNDTPELSGGDRSQFFRFYNAGMKSKKTARIMYHEKHKKAKLKEQRGSDVRPNKRFRRDDHDDDGGWGAPMAH